MAKKNKTQNKIKKRNAQLKKRLVKRRATGEYKARQKTRGRKIDVQSYVVSPRGRQVLVSGLVDPMAAPQRGQPLSVQDYFLLSRAIKNMSWDSKKWILEIEFTTGAVYQFIGVSQAVWISLKNAPSKGRAFHHLIYGYWSGTKGSKTYHPKYKEVRIR